MFPRARADSAVLKHKDRYWQFLKKLQYGDLVAYCPFWEPAGPVAHDIHSNYDGAFLGGTFAQPGIGDGKTSINTSTVRNFPAEKLSRFNGQEGTFSIWLKGSNWIDGVNDYILQITAGADSIWIRGGSAANTLTVAHIANAVPKAFSITFSLTGWFLLTLTWSVLGDALGLYINGVLMNSAAGLGVWAGGVPTVFVVGAQSAGGGSPWKGNMQHYRFYGAALSQDIIRKMVTKSPLYHFDALPEGATLLTSGYTEACALGSVLYAVHAPNKVGKSTDYGTTWNDFAWTCPQTLHSVFVSKDGILLASGDSKIYRSIDDGANWTDEQDLSVGYVNGWGWAQAPGGTIFAGEYSLVANSIYVWRSTDNGDTWTRKDGLFALSNKHTHQVFVDPETSRLYVTIGDTPKSIYYSDDSGDTWTQIFAARAAGTGFTGATSIPGARFFSDDLVPGNNQILKTTDDAALTVVYMPDWEFNVSYGIVASVHGTNTLFCTWWNENQYWGQKASIMKSVDAGITWETIVVSSSGAFRFSRIATDYRHRIPSELGYLICSCLDDQQLIRIPI